MKLSIEYLSVAATWLASSSLVALAIATAWLGAGWIWQLTPVPPTPTFSELPTADEAARRIVSQNWFGRASARSDSSPALPLEAFQLRGVVAPASTQQGKQQSNAGISIFSKSGAPLRTVAVGEEIADGWRLHAVAPGEAIVANGTLRHRFALHNDKSVAGTTTPAPTPTDRNAYITPPAATVRHDVDSRRDH